MFAYWNRTQSAAEVTFVVVPELSRRDTTSFFCGRLNYDIYHRIGTSRLGRVLQMIMIRGRQAAAYVW